MFLDSLVASFNNDFETVWLRNTQMSFFSVTFYLATAWWHQSSLVITRVGLIFASLGALGGVLSALTLLFCGALPKTIASSCSVLLVMLFDQLWRHAALSLTQATFYTMAVASVVRVDPSGSRGCRVC